MKITVTTRKGKTWTRIQVKKSERMSQWKYLNTLGIDTEQPTRESRNFLYYERPGNLIEEYIGWDIAKRLSRSEIIRLRQTEKNRKVKIEIMS